MLTPLTMMKTHHPGATVVYLCIVLLTDPCSAQTTNTTDPGCAGSSVYNSKAVLSDLHCYECSETYTKHYDPLNSPCRHNLSQVVVRQCSASDRYCKVERIDIVKFNTVTFLRRGCTGTCLYGCRFNGLAITYRRCVSCCDSPGCNTGSDAADTRAPRMLAFIVISICLLCN